MASVAVKSCSRTNSSGRLAVVAADLVHAEGDRLVLAGVLALDHQHRDAVDQKDDILAGAEVAVVIGELLGDLEDVVGRVVVIDEDQVALAVFLVVEVFAPVAQVLDEVAVAVDVGVQVAELAEDGALGVGVAGVELADFGCRGGRRRRARRLGAVLRRHVRVEARAAARLPRGGRRSSRCPGRISRMRAWTVLCSPGFGMNQSSVRELIALVASWNSPESSGWPEKW